MDTSGRIEKLKRTGKQVETVYVAAATHHGGSGWMDPAPIFGGGGQIIGKPSVMEYHLGFLAHHLSSRYLKDWKRT